ncbi:MAG: gfo/Idh/MocA family oxidoreductase, partial [Bacteroidetes bacterium]
YSPYEGWRVALNGTKGRIEAWLDIPHQKDVSIDQAEKHRQEMDQTGKEETEFEPIIVHKLWENFEAVKVPVEKSGHGGGDKRLQDKIFLHPDQTDPYERAAGLRDGVMSILIGVAARKSIESGEPIRIAELTTMEPRVKRL